MLKIVKWYKKRQRIKAIKDLIDSMMFFIDEPNAHDWLKKSAQKEIDKFTAELKQLEN